MYLIGKKQQKKTLQNDPNTPTLTNTADPYLPSMIKHLLYTAFQKTSPGSQPIRTNTTATKRSPEHAATREKMKKEKEEKEGLKEDNQRHETTQKRINARLNQAPKKNA